MAQHHLFRELDFSKENVVAWAEEQVRDEPTVEICDESVTNSVECVLREVLGGHYARSLSDYSRSELAEELLSHILDGVDKPVNTMTIDELLQEIAEVTAEYDVKTMGEFLSNLVEGDA